MSGRDPHAIAETVRRLRRAREWTQEELATQAAVSKATISTVETASFTGRPYSLRKIARALGVSVAELEAGKEDQDGATQVPESIVAGLDRQSERTYTEGEVIDLITSSDMTAEQQLAAIKAFRKRRAEVERELADMREGFRRQAEAESVQRQPVADNDGQPG